MCAVFCFIAVCNSFSVQAFRCNNDAYCCCVPIFSIAGDSAFDNYSYGSRFQDKDIDSFSYSFFPIYGACITAIKTTPKNLICFSKIYRTSFLKEIYYIRFPYAFPAVISAVKVGFTLAVLGAVVAEFIQPDAGLGRLILIAQSKYDIEIIYICIMMLVVQGLFVYISLSKVENMLINRGGYKNE